MLRFAGTDFVGGTQVAVRCIRLCDGTFGSVCVPVGSFAFHVASVVIASTEERELGDALTSLDRGLQVHPAHKRRTRMGRKVHITTLDRLIRPAPPAQRLIATTIIQSGPPCSTVSFLARQRYG